MMDRKIMALDPEIFSVGVPTIFAEFLIPNKKNSILMPLIPAI